MSSETALERRIRELEGDPEALLQGVLWDVTDSIADAMERKGMSRSQLADKLGRTRAYVTQLLRGNRNVTLKTLCTVACALDTELDVRLSLAATSTEKKRTVSQPTQSYVVSCLRQAWEARERVEALPRSLTWSDSLDLAIEACPPDGEELTQTDVEVAKSREEDYASSFAA